MKLQIVIVIVAAIAMSQAQNWGALPKHMVRQQISCILNEAGCDRIGLQIKGSLPEVLNNSCRRCNPQQAANARKLVGFMKSSFPVEWARIVQRFANNPNRFG